MRKAAIAAQLAPLLLPFGLFFVSSLTLTLAQAMGWGAVDQYEGTWLSAFEGLWDDALFGANVLFSLKISLYSALLSLLAGSALAYAIWQLPRGLSRWASVYRVPIILPHLTVAFLLFFLFSRRGLVPAAAVSLGAELGDWNFINSPAGWQLVAAYLYKEAPFVALMEISLLQTIPDDMMITARQLGAGSWLRYRKVVLPVLRPMMASLFVLLFLYCFGAFDIPYLLGVSRPSMIGVDIYRMYFEKDLVYRPLVMARLSLMFGFSALILLLTRRLSALSPIPSERKP